MKAKTRRKRLAQLAVVEAIRSATGTDAAIEVLRTYLRQRQEEEERQRFMRSIVAPRDVRLGLLGEG